MSVPLGLEGSVEKIGMCLCRTRSECCDTVGERRKKRRVSLWG